MVKEISSIREAYVEALHRAAKHRLVAYREKEGVYSVPSATSRAVEYTVEKTGSAWWEWSCTCHAGHYGAICQHKATALYAWAHHTSAVRAKAPSVPAQEVMPFPDDTSVFD